MPPGIDPATESLKSPRAAAVAGILFSLLFLTALALLLQAGGIRSLDTTHRVIAQGWKVDVALNLVPLSGVAFLWFVGVLRDRLGNREDRLFATVFLGSGLMFVGMIFISAAAIGALQSAYAAAPPGPEDAYSIRLIRNLAYNIASIYGLKMAAVFMVTASTLILRTRFTARWTAFLGYASAAVILLASQMLDWTIFLFPCWVLAVSASILVDAFAPAP